MKPEQMEAITRAVSHAVADWYRMAKDHHDDGNHDVAQDHNDMGDDAKDAMAALHAAWETIDNPSETTPAAFRAALDAIGHNQTTFAAHVGVTSRSVRHWAAGTPPPPKMVMLLLDHMRRAGQYGPVARTPQPLPTAQAGQG
mgnify:CR=1 FL=1